MKLDEISMEEAVAICAAADVDDLTTTVYRLVPMKKSDSTYDLANTVMFFKAGEKK